MADGGHGFHGGYRGDTEPRDDGGPLQNGGSSKPAKGGGSGQNTISDGTRSKLKQCLKGRLEEKISAGGGTGGASGSARTDNGVELQAGGGPALAQHGAASGGIGLPVGAVSAATASTHQPMLSGGGGGGSGVVYQAAQPGHPHMVMQEMPAGATQMWVQQYPQQHPQHQQQPQLIQAHPGGVHTIPSGQLVYQQATPPQQASAVAAAQAGAAATAVQSPGGVTLVPMQFAPAAMPGQVAAPSGPTLHPSGHIHLRRISSAPSMATSTPSQTRHRQKYLNRRSHDKNSPQPKRSREGRKKLTPSDKSYQKQRREHQHRSGESNTSGDFSHSDAESYDNEIDDAVSTTSSQLSQQQPPQQQQAMTVQQVAPAAGQHPVLARHASMPPTIQLPTGQAPAQVAAAAPQQQVVFGAQPAQNFILLQPNAHGQLVPAGQQHMPLQSTYSAPPGSHTIAASTAGGGQPTLLFQPHHMQTIVHPGAVAAAPSHPVLTAQLSNDSQASHRKLEGSVSCPPVATAMPSSTAGGSSVAASSYVPVVAGQTTPRTQPQVVSMVPAGSSAASAHGGGGGGAATSKSGHPALKRQGHNSLRRVSETVIHRDLNDNRALMGGERQSHGHRPLGLSSSAEAQLMGDSSTRSPRRTSPPPRNSPLPSLQEHQAMDEDEPTEHARSVTSESTSVSYEMSKRMERPGAAPAGHYLQPRQHETLHRAYSEPSSRLNSHVPAVPVGAAVAPVMPQVLLEGHSREIVANFQRESAQLDQMTRQLEQQHLSDLETLNKAKSHIEEKHRMRMAQLQQHAQVQQQVQAQQQAQAQAQQQQQQQQQQAALAAAQHQTAGAIIQAPMFPAGMATMGAGPSAVATATDGGLRQQPVAGRGGAEMPQLYAPHQHHHHAHVAPPSLMSAGGGGDEAAAMGLHGQEPPPTPNSLSPPRSAAAMDPHTDPSKTALACDTYMHKHQCSIPECIAHPEGKGRLHSIWSRFKAMGIIQQCHVIKARKATHNELQSVHSENHTLLYAGNTRNRRIQGNTRCFIQLECGGIGVDQDTVWHETHTGPVARMAVGCVIDLATRVAIGHSRNGFAVVRPPGHQAERMRAQACCYFNNVAIAAKQLHINNYAQKTLIVDWSITHGKGTQGIFYDDGTVLYISIHRHDNGTFFPGSGRSDQIGEAMGLGYTVNIPFSSTTPDFVAMRDADYVAAFKHIVLPIAKEFGPDIVLVSAGFDAMDGHGFEIGGYKVTPDCYGYMTSQLMTVTNVPGRVVLALEGGYDLKKICDASFACVEALMGREYDEPGGGCPVSDAAIRAIEETASYLPKYWRCMSTERRPRMRSEAEVAGVLASMATVSGGSGGGGGPGGGAAGHRSLVSASSASSVAAASDRYVPGMVGQAQVAMSTTRPVPQRQQLASETMDDDDDDDEEE
eukprot:scpid73915/ scgid12059/ Histone deacetylase 4